MNPRLVPPARLARSVLRTQSDERLTELARSGSDAAFEALVARHRHALVRHCARLLGNADAEEAVQEALLRAHAALRRGDPVRRIAPWLHVIAHNAALNLLRSRSARETSPLRDGDCEGKEDRSLEQRLALRELVSAVASLPERQRSAIVMRELEGRTYAEIADRLGSSPGAVRQLLNRARGSVRDRLAALLPWGSMLLGGGNGAAGARIGALSNACTVTVKVCAALIPAAALGVGGLSVADHLDGNNGHRQRIALAPAGVRARESGEAGPSSGRSGVASGAGRNVALPGTGHGVAFVLSGLAHASVPARSVDVALVTVRASGRAISHTSRTLPCARSSTPVHRGHPAPASAPSVTGHSALAASPSNPPPATDPHPVRWLHSVLSPPNKVARSLRSDRGEQS
jgi:RNA polymerase sigma factor (sigma-70 family)